MKSRIRRTSNVPDAKGDEQATPSRMMV